ncbi:MAG: transposase [Clostridiales bacterium]|nr:transposase [Clostridiales bacterium]
MLSCDGKEALNYDAHRYDKTAESKIAYIQGLAKEMPKPETAAYALGDSWYTNRKIISAFAESGYYYIGALKTNRIIYPQGNRINIANFANEMLTKDDFNPVTVKGSQYYAYII